MILGCLLSCLWVHVYLVGGLNPIFFSILATVPIGTWSGDLPTAIEVFILVGGWAS